MQRYRAFRWTLNGGTFVLPDIAETQVSFSTTRTSRDGMAIAGLIPPRLGGSLDVTFGLYRWSPETGMVNLTRPDGPTRFHTVTISGDGNTIAGRVSPGTWASGTGCFRWTPQTGLVPVRELDDVAAISDDGRVLVGPRAITNPPFRGVGRLDLNTGFQLLGPSAGERASHRPRQLSAQHRRYDLLHGEPGVRPVALAAFNGTMGTARYAANRWHESRRDRGHQRRQNIGWLRSW